MPISRIPAQSITGVHLACRACGAQMLIPIPPRNVPDQCFSCGAEMPGPALLPLLRELSWLHHTVGKADVTFEASVEGRMD